MSKIIDNGYTGVTTAKSDHTEEKYNLWHTPHPFEATSMKPVVYKNPESSVNPYDVPGQSYTTPIANYPTGVVLTNTVEHLLKEVKEDPIIGDIFNPMIPQLDEKNFDQEQNKLPSRLKQISSLK